MTQKSQDIHPYDQSKVYSKEQAIRSLAYQLASSRDQKKVKKAVDTYIDHLSKRSMKNTKKFNEEISILDQLTMPPHLNRRQRVLYQLAHAGDDDAKARLALSYSQWGKGKLVDKKIKQIIKRLQKKKNRLYDVFLFLCLILFFSVIAVIIVDTKQYAWIVVALIWLIPYWRWHKQ